MSMTFPAGPYRSGRRMSPKMFDDACMTIAPRRHQHPMGHLAAIVQDVIPRKRGHATIRFMHDQIGCSKVPVAALAAGKGRIEPSMSDPAQAKRERSDAWMK